ncbi:MAG TPA: hypothetical protein VGR89_16330 [Puia sp.]|nr:hypothetical protein [Puia sp.]
MRVVVLPDDGKLPEDQRQELLSRFEAGEGCEWCGGLHHKQCPRIRHIIYHPSDPTKINEIEFWRDGEWDRSGVLYPEDVV